MKVMGKVKEFTVTFTNPQRIYYPGQVIAGEVVLVLMEPLEAKGICVRLEGNSSVSWTEQRTSRRRRGGSHHHHQDTVIHRTANESHFSYCISVWTATFSTTRGSKELIPVGRHTFPFQFGLPLALPSSFEGSYGFVRYWCEVKVDRPWAFDVKCKIPFTVLGIVDLNNMPHTLTPVGAKDQKYICCLFCKTGPIAAKVTINKSGFVPGELIYINAQINNQTNREIKKTEATLKSVITYHAEGKHRTEKRSICRASGGRIGPYSSDVWVNIPLLVKAVPPTALAGSRLIDVDYHLEFSVDPAGIARDLDLLVPVTMGTIPHQSSSTVFSSAPPLPPPEEAPSGSSSEPFPDQSSIPIREAPPPPHIEEYPDIPPPSYEECVYGKVNLRDTSEEAELNPDCNYGVLDYAPMYPVYYHSRDKTAIAPTRVVKT